MFDGLVVGKTDRAVFVAIDLVFPAAHRMTSSLLL